MREVLAGIILLAITCSAVIANPVQDELPPASPANHAEAQNFAVQLAEAVKNVSEQYVRPVSQAELAGAALRGLFEAADRPVPVSLQADVQEAAANIYKLQRLILRIRENLGNSSALRGDKAIYAALQAMTRSLDPYCAVLTRQELEEANNPDISAGIGLELLDNGEVGPLVVKAVAPGTPAQKAGLRPGDQITQIGDQKPMGPAASVLANLLQRDNNLTVLRPGNKEPLRLVLKPDGSRQETILGVMRRADNSWDYFLDPRHGIAHVRVASLKGGTCEELVLVLSELVEKKVRGLILDLRWCPGGYLDPAQDAADLFLGDYDLPHYVHPTPANLVALADLCLEHHCANAIVRYRDGRVHDRMKRGEGGFIDFPIVVLVNAETSGGAELIAAVLQDNRRAFVAGQRTKGKASVQIVVRLREDIRLTQRGPAPNMGLRLTNGMLIRPSGKNLHRFPDSKPGDDWGVRPDAGLEFRVSAELNRQLRDWWQLQAIRPGPSKESLPVDDPVTDPQRQAAARFLLSLRK
jgi:carboxyl-terminal processing protease